MVDDSDQVQRQRSRQNTLPVVSRPPVPVPRRNRATVQRGKPRSQPQPPPPFALSTGTPDKSTRVYDEVGENPAEAQKKDERKKKGLPPPPLVSQDTPTVPIYEEMNGEPQQTGGAESSGMYSLAGPADDVNEGEMLGGFGESFGAEGGEVLHSPPPDEPLPPLPENIYDVRSF